MQNFEFSESTDRYDFTGTVKAQSSFNHIRVCMQIIRFIAHYSEVLQARARKRRKLTAWGDDRNLVCNCCNGQGALLGIKKIRSVNFYMCMDCKADFDRFVRLEEEKKAVNVV